MTKKVFFFIEGVGTLVSRMWFWFLMGTVTSVLSACLSAGRCPAAESDVLTPSRWVLTAENFLEGKNYTKWQRQGRALANNRLSV